MTFTPPWRRGLYLLTPDLIDTARLCESIEAALRGGVALLQYRSKLADPALRREQAIALLALCRRYRVPLLINDDVKLAASIGADGVHLGEFDATVEAARRALGETAIIGASCYDDGERAWRAWREGASYVAFGAFHPSPTKPLARRASIGLLADTTTPPLPKVAIGGITIDNAQPLIDAGADLIAVISAVFDADDITAAARQLAMLFQE